jgi:hypothetical protein
MEKLNKKQKHQMLSLKNGSFDAFFVFHSAKKQFLKNIIKGPE